MTALGGIPSFDDAEAYYLSPGIQIGWGFRQGFFYSAQITIGWTPENPIGSDAMFPGITIGFRRNKGFNFRYIDLQIAHCSPKAFLSDGIGIGLIWLSDGAEKDSGVISRGNKNMDRILWLSHLRLLLDKTGETLA